MCFVFCSPSDSMPILANAGNPFVTPSPAVAVGPASLGHTPAPAPVPVPAPAPHPLIQMGALQAPGSPALSHPQHHHHTFAQTVSSAPGSPLFRSLSPGPSSLQGSPAKGPEISMTNLHVPLDAIKPSE